MSLRIIHILRAPMGGVLRHVRDLALEHTAQGHIVGIICDNAGNSGYNEAMLEKLSSKLALGVTRVSMDKNVGIKDIFAAAKIRNIVAKQNPDVIHGHGAKGGLFSRLCGTLTRVKSKRPARIYSPHGGSLHFDPASNAGNLYFKVERGLERYTDQLIFVAAHEQKTYIEKIGDPTCPAKIIYNGISEKEFSPVGTDDNAADFVFIGELRELKGPDLLVRAISRLKAEGASGISAVIVGDGEYREELHSLIVERGLQANVTMRSAMPARGAFKLGKTVVMPSRGEAMPYIVLEALAAGKPLVATNVGGIPEIFGNARDVLIEPDIDLLTARMRLALENLDDLRSRMPDIKRLQSKFTISAMASSMIETYNDAIEMRVKKNG